MAITRLNTEAFIRNIFDYHTEQEWKYKGSRPAIIYFYANGCDSCRMVDPVLEELSEAYSSQIDIFKVDTEVEQELVAVFGIHSIPLFLIIPMNEQPILLPGAYPKNVFKEVIETTLLKIGVAEE